MIKKLTALAALVLLLLTQRPQAQGPAGAANIYFVDIGTGASTLIVSPTGKTLLVDGGPDGSATKIAALMSTLGIATIDYTVVTHYHIDHISGITELINAGKVARHRVRQRRRRRRAAAGHVDVTGEHARPPT